jgi:octaprenyl-diphosphate synthase
MRYGTPEQSAVIRGAVERGGLDEFAPVLVAVRETGALDYVRRQAESEAQRALAALESLPRSTYRDSLIQLAAFAVDRSY